MGSKLDSLINDSYTSSFEMILSSKHERFPCTKACNLSSLSIHDLKNELGLQYISHMSSMCPGFFRQPPQRSSDELIQKTKNFASSNMKGYCDVCRYCFQQAIWSSMDIIEKIRYVLMKIIDTTP